MDERKKRRTYPASVTVEACFVVPIIIICMVCIVWITFFLYNSIKASADADSIIFELEKEIAESGKNPDKLDRNLTDTLTGYLFAKTERAELKKDGNDIFVGICVRMNSSSEGLLGQLLSRIGEIRYERETGLQTRTETERIIRAARETVKIITDQIKGGS